MGGGTLEYRGSGASTQTINALVAGNGAGRIDLDANGGTPKLTITTLPAKTGGWTTIISGVGSTIGLAGSGAELSITTFNAVGGSGVNGTNTIPTRPDIIVDPTLGGNGTGAGAGFAVKDSVTGLIRPIDISEQATTLPTTTSQLSNSINYLLSTTQSAIPVPTLLAQTDVATMTFGSGGGVNTAGWSLDSQVNASGYLFLPGNVRESRVAASLRSQNQPIYFHTPGTAANVTTINAYLFSGNSSNTFTKDGGGTLDA